MAFFSLGTKKIDEELPHGLRGLFLEPLGAAEEDGRRAKPGDGLRENLPHDVRR